MKRKPMKKINKTAQREYDFQNGVRGKYAKRYARGTNVIVLEPSIAKVFPNSKSVNDALRILVDTIRNSKKPR